MLHIVLSLIRIIPGFEEFRNNQEVYTTIATVVSTFVMYIVLYNVSFPLNLMRKFVYVSMVMLSILAALDLIPFMQLDLSYRRSVEEYNVHTYVVGDYWYINDKPTSARAFLDPNITIISEDGKTYVTPVLSINKDERWVLNGFNTSIMAKDSEDITLKVVGRYWYINNQPTKAKAVIQPKIIYNFDNYYEPELKNR